MKYPYLLVSGLHVLISSKVEVKAFFVYLSFCVFEIFITSYSLQTQKPADARLCSTNIDKSI